MVEDLEKRRNVALEKYHKQKALQDRLVWIPSGPTRRQGAHASFCD